MATKTFRRGDFVKYEGSIQRFNGTWWTVKNVRKSNGGTTYDLNTPGIGTLRDVRAASVNDEREQA